MAITEAAGRAGKELDVEIIIMKKTSSEFAALQEKPPCPSVSVNGNFIAKNDVVTFEQLKIAIQS